MRRGRRGPLDMQPVAASIQCLHRSPFLAIADSTRRPSAARIRCDQCRPVGRLRPAYRRLRDARFGSKGSMSGRRSLPIGSRGIIFCQAKKNRKVVFLSKKITYQIRNFSVDSREYLDLDMENSVLRLIIGYHLALFL